MLDRVLRENVLVVTESGCGRLSDLVEKRREEIEKVEEELELLLKDFSCLERQDLHINWHYNGSPTTLQER